MISFVVTVPDQVNQHSKEYGTAVGVDVHIFVQRFTQYNPETENVKVNADVCKLILEFRITRLAFGVAKGSAILLIIIIIIIKYSSKDYRRIKSAK